MRGFAALVLLAMPLAASAQAHFHHVHLNATNPATAIEFYTSKFKARRESFAGLGDAVWTGDSWLLFTKVDSPPPRLPSRKRRSTSASTMKSTRSGSRARRASAVPQELP